MRKLTVPEQHQLRIARDTLRMTPAMAAIMGGMTHEEAREVIGRLTACKKCGDCDCHRPIDTPAASHQG